MDEDRPDRFTDDQRSALEVRRGDQDRTLAAVHQLEAALATAGPKRARAWRAGVLATLEELDRTSAAEQTNADRPDSLLSDIARTQPRLRSRVRGTRGQYRQVRDAITGLRHELGTATDNEIDIADVRQRVAWLLTALRHQRARESDLIYEAYYDAFRHDLEDDMGI